MPLDRRAMLSAAMDAVEENNGELPQDYTPPEEPGEGGEGEKPLVSPAPPPEEQKPKVDEPEEPEEQKAAEGEKKPDATDKPPQSWRAAQKAKWGTLDADVRGEILRRERDADRILSESANARQIATAFVQVVQPFMARIQSLGVNPIMAVQELMKADHVLHSSPMPQRAALMAKLINDYGIDVVELDKALSGSQAGVDPMQATLDRMLQERMKPIQDFLQTQQQNEYQRRNQEQQQVDQTVEQMAADTTKYPYFEQVRADMADLIEISSKRGVYLSLEQAYNRAVGMNPEVSQEVAKQQDKGRLQAAHQRAQKALAASKSVNGAPGGTPGGAQINVKDRRATIAAAFDALEGR